MSDIGPGVVRSREIARLARIQQGHHAKLLSIRRLAGELIGEAWDAYGGIDDRAFARFPAAAATITDAARTATATAAAGYMRANDLALGVRSTVPKISTPVPRGGLSSERLYQRAVEQARRSISRGSSYPDAMNAGHARAVGAARTDVILANREAMTEGGQTRPWVVGYRRILTGVSCALCAAASTQRYKVARLQPIHPHCDCDIGEIFGTEDPGAVINRRLLDDIQAAGRETGTEQYWRGPYMVDEDGVIRYRVTNYVLDDDGRRVLTPNGSPRRYYTPGDRVLPEVVQHGELGELLTDRRHVFTAADDLADVELPATRTRPAPLSTARAVDVAGDVLDDVPADIVAEAKKTAPRAPRRVYGVTDPDVVAAAERWGVSPDEVLVARQRIPDVKAAMYEAAERVQAEAFLKLDDWGATRMTRPPKNLRGGGEYDWLQRLDASERRRLGRTHFTQTTGFAPDQLAETMAARGVQVDNVDDAMKQWLEQSRRYEAAGAIRRGKLPSAKAYSGSIDPADLVQLDDGYDVGVILRTADPLELAGHIAQVDAELVLQEARDYLGDALAPRHGPAPFRMSFQAWEEEVRVLEYGLREFPAEMPPNAVERLAELVPPVLDDGQDFEDLYAAIVHKARQAGEEVPAHARIPWQ